jgi:methionine-gamma-lyase
MSTPVVHSATFAFPTLEAMNREKELHAGSAYYQRHGHPTIRATERTLAQLEEAEEALLFASGMAAISAVFLSRLSAGDHVVALHQCYGGTHGLLQWGAQRLGWTFELVDARTPATWAQAFRPNTRIFHVESPTNPTLCVVDVKAAADLAHARGARLTLDNTVASPLGQRGLALGADVVIYSVTKSIGGHADLLAGAALGSREALEPVWNARTVFGPLPAPEVAWQVERSIKSIALRVQAANDNALELAGRLSRHPGVEQVFYPGLPDHPGHALAQRQMRGGFGPLLSFEVQGGAEAAAAFVDALGLVLHAPSLGGVETLVSLPAHTSHVQLGPGGRAAAGIPEGLVRLSAGIEDIEDLWADLSGALSQAATAKVRG